MVAEVAEQQRHELEQRMRQLEEQQQAERQALAMMDFPGIAKVSEAGATPEGRPYFAMEFVKGEPINTYCDRHRLDTRTRLELFARVCDAIQHAHQKGGIHRDLKPANIMIDQRGEPVVMDFGLAKRGGQEDVRITREGSISGSPAYMSPEQIDGKRGDPRSDVYACLLYTSPSPRDRG